MFINLCKYAGLNPWLKEAYCIKYGNEPATMVVGKEAFMKRAEKTPGYDGFEAGVIVLSGGEVIYRTGTLKLPEEEIMGGYAEVYRKDRSHPYRIEVAFDEYAGRKKDGSLNSQWSKRPGNHDPQGCPGTGTSRSIPGDLHRSLYSGRGRDK